MLLSLLRYFLWSCLQDPQFVMEYFNNSIHTPEGVGLYTLLQVSKIWLIQRCWGESFISNIEHLSTFKYFLHQVLRVLFASVSYLSTEQRKSLHKDLIMLVKKFSIPPELISTSVDICTVISSLDAAFNSKSKYMINYNRYIKCLDLISEKSFTILI